MVISVTTLLQTGLRGDSGVSGYSGYSGYSGLSGISGYSGLGISGWSGISGYSGSGISGWSGISGYSGISGWSGWSGYSGSGISGWSGWSGYSGSLSPWKLITTNYTANVNDRIIVDSGAGSFNIALPMSPTTGSYIIITDGNNLSTNNVIVQGNGSTIEGDPEDVSLDLANVTYEFIYGTVTWHATATTGPTGISGYSGYSGALSSIDIQDVTTSSSSWYPVITGNATGTFSNIAISSTKLYFNPNTGTLNATGFNSLSDINYKQNIVSISNSLDVISKLNGYEFDWKDTNKKSSGLIAQEVEKILPHLVDVNEHGIKSINYDGLIAYILNAINELRDR